MFDRVCAFVFVFVAVVGWTTLFIDYPVEVFRWLFLGPVSCIGTYVCGVSFFRRMYTWAGAAE